MPAAWQRASTMAEKSWLPNPLARGCAEGLARPKPLALPPPASSVHQDAASPIHLVIIVL